MPAIKLFTEPSHYSTSHRRELIDLLKPFIEKKAGYSAIQRQEEYGLLENDFIFSNCLEKSDLAVLPMSWNYYRVNGLIKNAIEFVKKANKHEKKVVSWVSGDFGVDVPDLPNLIVLRANGYQSKLPSNHFGMPAFFQDPLKKWYHQNEVPLREWRPKPVIGFCGQAKGSLLQYVWATGRTGIRNLKYHSGISPLQAHSIFPPPVMLRAKTLALIEKDERLESNFIKRSKYRAGADSEEERKKTTLEFFDNMVNSDYVVCIRGGGNFSVRLYETLAMGRIPVFVNTDCTVPFSKKIQWRKHVVWIESSEIEQIGDQILTFHAQLNPVSFYALQKTNREFWLEKLTLGGFFKNLII